jgi:hypothetical protein
MSQHCVPACRRVGRPAPTWQLFDFEERYDRWADVDGGDADLRLEVMNWILGRQDDPYSEAKPDTKISGLFYATIPHTEVHGRAVLCSFWIFNASHQVRCDSIATLALPH